MRLLNLRTLPPLALLAALGCAQDESPSPQDIDGMPAVQPPSPAEAAVDLRLGVEGFVVDAGALTLAEDDPAAVLVDVVGLQVRHAAGADRLIPCEADLDATGWRDVTWTDVPMRPVSIDLLAIDPDATATLAQASLPTGYITALRLTLGEDPGPRVLRADGAIEVLDLDAGPDSGPVVLEHDTCVTLDGGGSADLTLDFTTASRLLRSDSGRWVLEPDLSVDATRGDFESGDAEDVAPAP